MKSTSEQKQQTNNITCNTPKYGKLNHENTILNTRKTTRNLSFAFYE